MQRSRALEKTCEYKEEYPLCSPHLKPIPKSNKYELKMDVNSLKPIQQFIKGLKDEVEIISM